MTGPPKSTTSKPPRALPLTEERDSAINKWASTSKSNEFLSSGCWFLFQDLLPWNQEFAYQKMFGRLFFLNSPKIFPRAMCLFDLVFEIPLPGIFHAKCCCSRLQVTKQWAAMALPYQDIPITSRVGTQVAGSPKRRLHVVADADSPGVLPDMCNYYLPTFKVYGCIIWHSWEKKSQISQESPC